MNYGVFYINRDNSLEILHRLDETGNVGLVNEEFRRLMFNLQDV